FDATPPAPALSTLPLPDALPIYARAGVARDDDHRSDVPAAHRHLAALADHLALVAGQRLILAHAPVRLLVDQRPDDRAQLARMADRDDRRCPDEPLEQLLEHGPHHDHARRRRALLA